jgi:hypothetical protein
VSLRRLESHPRLPGGCAGRSWRGRACLRHGFGSRKPPHALGLAAGQPSSTSGRRDALELLGNLRPELTVTAQDACECEPGFVLSMFLHVITPDAAPHRAGSIELVPSHRVDAPCAVRETACVSACPAGAPQHRAAV